MPTLHSRLGDWQLDHVHEWADRELVIRRPAVRLIGPETRVATIGSCFASELAALMGSVGIQGGMHPAGLFYSTATIRQELERIAGGWPERAAQPAWRVADGFVDPFRDYDTLHPTEDVLAEKRREVEAKAEVLFRGAGLVVITLGLIETWRDRTTGNTFRQIPHPAVFPTLQPEFHRLTVSEMLADLERIRIMVRETLGVPLVLTTSPVPLHSTFTPLDVRVANIESKSRIRAAVSEFVDRHDDVHYFHSYEMVVTAERQSDYYREDGRHVHRHAVRYIVSEFLRLFAEPVLHIPDEDPAWLTPIAKTARTVAPDPRPARARPPARRRSFPERLVRGLGRRATRVIGRVSGRT